AHPRPGQRGHQDARPGGDERAAADHRVDAQPWSETHRHEVPRHEPARHRTEADTVDRRRDAEGRDQREGPARDERELATGAMPARNRVTASCAVAASESNAAIIAGSEGRNMSIESAPRPTMAVSSTGNARERTGATPAHCIVEEPQGGFP